MAKKTDLQDYQAQVSSNEDTFNRMLKKIRPDIWVLMDLVDETKINPYILLKVIRQLKILSMGTGYGQVSINVEDGVVRFVRGEESDKLNEPIILVKKDVV